MLLLAIFLVLVCLGVTFSLAPVLPGPPFAVLAILLIPFWPEYAVAVDDTTWWVAITVASVGVVITVIDFAAPWLAKIFESVLGASSRPAAIGSFIGLFVGVMMSILMGCFGITIPFLAALPIPLMLITPFLGALLGEMSVTGPVGENSSERNTRLFRSAFVQWMGLLTTIILKVIYCLVVAPIGIWLIWRNWS
jgi:uncharacterized protein YqgC (DUF456 family)